MIKNTAAQLSAALEKGEITSVELTKLHLDRIADVEPKVKAFLYVDGDNALKQAAAVDADRASGKKLGPLAGIPLALKDVLAQEGVPTTAGSKILQGWKPPYDSTVVAKLKAAGVVILGKTNIDEFAMGS
jgi:aspartyl-tRNA(Asn)/glutamyl-tRNA(Gln) amidotransferase subunit A